MTRPDDCNGYPKIKAWMDACAQADGLKEVHEEWMTEGGPVKTL